MIVLVVVPVHACHLSLNIILHSLHHSLLITRLRYQGGGDTFTIVHQFLSARTGLARHSSLSGCLYSQECLVRSSGEGLPHSERTGTSPWHFQYAVSRQGQKTLSTEVTEPHGGEGLESLSQGPINMGTRTFGIVPIQFPVTTCVQGPERKRFSKEKIRHPRDQEDHAQYTTRWSAEVKRSTICSRGMGVTAESTLAGSIL